VKGIEELEEFGKLRRMSSTEASKFVWQEVVWHATHQRGLYRELKAGGMVTYRGLLQDERHGPNPATKREHNEALTEISID
jgi:hypothetical protein